MAIHVYCKRRRHDRYFVEEPYWRHFSNYRGGMAPCPAPSPGPAGAHDCRIFGRTQCVTSSFSKSMETAHLDSPISCPGACNLDTELHRVESDSTQEHEVAFRYLRISIFFSRFFPLKQSLGFELAPLQADCLALYHWATGDSCHFQYDVSHK